jgi:hypothetical protein
MSHSNITMRNRYSHEETLASRIDILTVEKKRLEMLLETCESNLQSIFDRVKSGEEVYLCYEDGSILYLTGSPNQPKTHPEATR